MKLNPLGRDWSLLVNWDDLGKLYAGFIISWTVILAAGSLWLIVNRHLTSVKIRNVGLAVAAVSFLHVYLVKIFLAYTTNGHFTCGAEYWIMSIYLPFGIALFQANTVQLESISEEQQSLLHREALDSQGVPNGQSQPRPRNIKVRWQSSTAAQRTYVYIGFGMLAQLIITGVIYACSPTLQGDWSSYGNISFTAGQKKCRGSLEWIPSAFWQLFWSWIYGPWILYKIRHINDVHYWRLQVILTVVAGLPGAPLWLASLYTPPGPWRNVNKWWVPPMWLAPGIIAMQGVTIFFPIYEAFKDRWQLQRTLNILQNWEDSRKNDEYQSMSNGTSFASSDNKRTSILAADPARRRSEMYTMAALEKALAVNPQPLLQFAATQDFTAENIVFLLQVRRWHAEWDRSVVHNNTLALDTSTRTRLLDMAVEIYRTSISEATAEFPVNISGRHRSTLDRIFRGPVAERAANNDSDYNRGATLRAADLGLPAMYKGKLINMANVVRRESSMESTSKLFPNSSFADSALPSPAQASFSFDPHPCVRPLGVEVLMAGPGVGKDVFDGAEESVKYLVLTNTWQKLVKAHYHVDLS